VHLGLFVRFRSFAEEPPPPTAGTRLAMSTVGTTVRLAGPSACELLEPDDESRLRARLGPDPLRRDADPEQAWRALRRRRAPLGAVLLDQRVVAGVGNVFRAEALFACGIAPSRAAATLDREDFEHLWATLVTMLRHGVRTGRIVTVDPHEAGMPRGRMRRDDPHYVYRREGLPCRRCGTPVAAADLAARRIFWCPKCQPR
jgi:endonuclease VIII